MHKGTWKEDVAIGVYFKNKAGHTGRVINYNDEYFTVEYYNYITNKTYVSFYNSDEDNPLGGSMYEIVQMVPPPNSEPEEEHLPDWAAKLSNGKILEPGTQLITRDGFKHGNAVIMTITTDVVSRETLYHICTDAGNTMKLNIGELLAWFQIGKYVVAELLPHVERIWEEYNT